MRVGDRSASAPGRGGRRRRGMSPGTRYYRIMGMWASRSSTVTSRRLGGQLRRRAWRSGSSVIVRAWSSFAAQQFTAFSGTSRGLPSQHNGLVLVFF